MKDKIRDVIAKRVGAFSFPATVNEEDLSRLIHDCIQDLGLGGEWVSARNGGNIADNQLCWVLMPSGKIEVMYFNHYIKFGGLENYWQDMEGNDHSLEGTMYIEIKKPLPPTEDKA